MTFGLFITVIVTAPFAVAWCAGAVKGLWEEWTFVRSQEDRLVAAQEFEADEWEMYTPAEWWREVAIARYELDSWGAEEVW